MSADVVRLWGGEYETRMRSPNEPRATDVPFALPADAVVLQFAVVGKYEDQRSNR